MGYATELRNLLKYYGETVEPLIEQRQYFMAGMEMGNLTSAFQDIYKSSRSEMSLRLQQYLFGFIARFQILQEVCQKENADEVEFARKRLEERRSLVGLIVGALAEKETEE